MCEKKLKKPLQPQINFSGCESYEKRIEKCKRNLEYLNRFPPGWKKKDMELLILYYQNRLTYYQNKIDTAHSLLIDVSNPTIL